MLSVCIMPYYSCGSQDAWITVWETLSEVFRETGIDRSEICGSTTAMNFLSRECRRGKAGGR